LSNTNSFIKEFFAFKGNFSIIEISKRSDIFLKGEFRKGWDIHLTKQILAEYLLSLGAVDAMNLDGGGSTTMFVDGKVVNHPSYQGGRAKGQQCADSENSVSL